MSDLITGFRVNRRSKFPAYIFKSEPLQLLKAIYSECKRSGT